MTSATSDAPSGRPLTRHRSPRKAIALVTGIAGVAALLSFVVARGSSEPSRRTSVGDAATTVVDRRDLVETATFSGTLGYSDVRPLPAAGQGTLTMLAREGSTVARGEALYALDEVPVRLLYGSTPMYRDLHSGVSDGPDVKQLEANLVAMGFDPDDDIEVDPEWDYATTDAVKEWEDARGVAEDGVVSRSEAAFLPGRRIVGEHTLMKGSAAGPGSEIYSTSSAERVVSLDVDVEDIHRFHKSERVTIELPNDDEVRGIVASVGKVATVNETDSEAGPTIAVSVSLSARVNTGGIDQAPVDVIVETSRARNVLAVPVSALLATGDGFGVEVVDGGETRIVTVEPGTYADGWVEIEGPGIDPGTNVVIPS